LAERGWIKKSVRGWLLTPSGKHLGSQQQESEQSGIPYVTWPETLLDNPRLLLGVAQINAEESVASLPALDGRSVKTEVERRVANWFYLAGVVYAQNYELTWGSETLFVDFFVPEIQLCVDYWPSDSNAAGLARQLEKQALYKKHKVNFIELRNEDLAQVDEILAKVLLKNGLAVY
jgi:hypothetical protein